LLLGRVASAHLALHKLEHALQANHLACCIFPRVQTPVEVAVALGHLSAERTGALIAFEQQDNLNDYVAGGTVVDAQLSAGLLESLFYPGNPLHDGAVIVRSSRILAAGVFLPVAAEHRDSVHGRLLGARHRAALGLSRLTDALLFVVSEETGTVSLAAKGALLHPVNVHALLPDSAIGREASPAPTAASALVRMGKWVARAWRSGSGGKTV
jgi:DNA integrity scanning protein DisA with diadenylate cyclase activity